MSRHQQGCTKQVQAFLGLWLYIPTSGSVVPLPHVLLSQTPSASVL